MYSPPTMKNRTFIPWNSFGKLGSNLDAVILQDKVSIRHGVLCSQWLFLGARHYDSGTRMRVEYQLSGFKSSREDVFFANTSENTEKMFRGTPCKRPSLPCWVAVTNWYNQTFKYNTISHSRLQFKVNFRRLESPIFYMYWSRNWQCRIDFTRQFEQYQPQWPL